MYTLPYWIPYRAWRITYLITGSHYCKCCDLYFNSADLWISHTEERWHTRERETWAVLYGTKPFSGALHRHSVPAPLPKKFQRQHQAAAAAVVQWRAPQPVKPHKPQRAFYCECCSLALATLSDCRAHFFSPHHARAQAQWMRIHGEQYYFGRMDVWADLRRDLPRLGNWRQKMAAQLAGVNDERICDWMLLAPSKRTTERRLLCFRKKQFGSAAHASENIVPGKGLLAAYLCTFCHHFHLGHIEKWTLRTYSQRYPHPSPERSSVSCLYNN